jgi:hypothetical protein
VVEQSTHNPEIEGLNPGAGTTDRIQNTTTYKWVQYARVLHNSGQERLPRDKRSSFLGTVISYEENETIPDF